MVKLQILGIFVLLLPGVVSSASIAEQLRANTSDKLNLSLYSATVDAGAEFGQINHSQLFANADRSADEWAEDKPRTTKSKSTTKAVLLSALLPGLGEHYLGDRKRARYLFVAEGISWVGIVSFKLYSHARKDDYFALAASRAGVSLEGRSDEYIDAVGFYDNVDDYNTAGRIIEPERPYYNPVDPAVAWRWESADARDQYRALKNRSVEAARRGDFAIGASVALRIISIIDTVIMGRNMKQADDDFLIGEKLSISIDTNPWRTSSRIVASYSIGL